MSAEVQLLLDQIKNQPKLIALPVQYLPYCNIIFRKKYFYIFKDENIEFGKELCIFNLQQLPEQSGCYTNCCKDYMLSCSGSCDQFCKDCCNIDHLNCQACLIQSLLQCYTYGAYCKQCWSTYRKLRCKKQQEYDEPVITYSFEVDRQAHQEEGKMLVPKIFEIQNENAETQSFIQKSGLGTPITVLANLIINNSQQGLIQQFVKFPVDIDDIYYIQDKNSYLFKAAILAFHQVFSKYNMADKFHAIMIGGKLEGYLVYGHYLIEGAKCCYYQPIYKIGDHVLFNSENQFICRIKEQHKSLFYLYDKSETIILGKIYMDKTFGCFCSIFQNFCCQILLQSCTKFNTFEVDFGYIKDPMSKLLILFALPYLGHYGLIPEQFNSICSHCLRGLQFHLMGSLPTFKCEYDQEESLFIKGDKQIKVEDVIHDLKKQNQGTLVGKSIDEIKQKHIKDINVQKLSTYTKMLSAFNKNSNFDQVVVEKTQSTINQQQNQIQQINQQNEEVKQNDYRQQSIQKENAVKISLSYNQNESQQKNQLIEQMNNNGIQNQNEVQINLNFQEKNSDQQQQLNFQIQSDQNNQQIIEINIEQNNNNQENKAPMQQQHQQQQQNQKVDSNNNTKINYQAE